MTGLELLLLKFHNFSIIPRGMLQWYVTHINQLQFVFAVNFQQLVFENVKRNITFVQIAFKHIHV